MAESLLRLEAVKAVTGLGRSAIYDAMKRGQFPRSVALTPKVRAWVSSEIDAWVESKIAASRG